jgi:transposase
MKAYSVDLRQRVLDDCDADLGTKAAAEKYKVSPSWVRKIKRQRRETGSIEPLTARPGPEPALAAHGGRLRELLQAKPDRTAADCREALGVDVAVVTVWRAIRRLGFTHKKSDPRGRAQPARRGRAPAEVARGGGARTRRAKARVPR